MKKLTAGIFAGILTIVGVNAADAAIATKGYVDSNFATKTALGATDAEVATKAAQSDLDATNEAVAKKADQTALEATNALLGGDFNMVDNTVSQAISKLRNDLGALTGDESVGSISDQIANALNTKLGEDFPANSTVQDELALKANAADVYTKTEVNDTVQGLNTAINGKVAQDAFDTLSGKVTANETAIGTLNGEGEGSVKKQIADAQSTLQGNIDGKMNTNAAVAGKMITTGSDGQVVALQPVKNDTAGTYVLTATVDDTGNATYYWESIARDPETQE